LVYGHTDSPFRGVNEDKTSDEILSVF